MALFSFRQFTNNVVDEAGTGRVCRSCGRSRFADGGGECDYFSASGTSARSCR